MGSERASIAGWASESRADRIIVRPRLSKVCFDTIYPRNARTVTIRSRGRKSFPVQRTFTNLLCSDPGRTASFYERLLGMRRHADFGWFVILTHDDMPSLEFGLLDRTHETVPSEVAAAPAGVIVTFVVEDVHAVHEQARTMDAEIVREPTDLFYGQRRMLLRDPEGTVVDVSSPTPA